MLFANLFLCYWKQFSALLQYKNVRPDYLSNIWKVINWKYASEVYEKEVAWWEFVTPSEVSLLFLSLYVQWKTMYWIRWAFLLPMLTIFSSCQAAATCDLKHVLLFYSSFQLCKFGFVGRVLLVYVTGLGFKGICNSFLKFGRNLRASLLTLFTN